MQEKVSSEPAEEEQAEPCLPPELHAIRDIAKNHVLLGSRKPKELNVHTSILSDLPGYSYAFEYSPVKDGILETYRINLRTGFLERVNADGGIHVSD